MNPGAAAKGKEKTGAQSRPGSAAPRPRTASARTPVESREDPYDALTDLFLGDAQEQVDQAGAPALEPKPLPAAASTCPAPPASPPPPPPPHSGPAAARDDRAAPSHAPVEGLILGHLPVLAHAWAAQYARRAAEIDAQPVGFVRIQPDALAIDLVGLPARRLSEVKDLPSAPGAALERAAALAGRWVLRIDGLDEPGLMRTAGLDTITLLTSADEAAVVAAYRTLKRLTLAEDPGGGARPKRLRLAIMGATDERARAVADKLTGAAAAFLSRSLEIGPAIDRIGSGAPPLTLYRGPADLGTAAVLELISSAPRPTAAKPPARQPIIPDPDSLLPAALDDRPGAHPPVLVAPAPGSPSLDEPALARHVTGLTPLPARCPFAKEVELAIDVVGRAHVLGRAADDDPDAAVRDALIAAAWLTEHAELVGLTAPRGLKLETARPPVRHVFIQQSKNASAMLRTGMRVHLLSRAQGGRETSIELE